jgi:MFS transporter, DHA2 family, lincomycin resistance protein
MSSASESTSRRDFAVIATLVIAAFTVILNETTINIAIPNLVEVFDITEGTAQWLVTGFLLTTGVFIPTTGFLMQKFTTRTLYIAAMSVFCLGTLISGLAPAFPVLLLGRIIQALGTGLMMPLLVIAVAPAIGPTMAGLIMSVLSWRWVFLIILPIALAALAYGAKTLVNVTEVSDPTLDVPSVFLSALAFGGIVYGFSSIGGEGGGSVSFGWRALAPLLIGLIALAVFAYRQLHIESPLLDLRAFGFKMFALAMATMACLTLALFGSFMLVPLYLQNVHHLDAKTAGLVMLPGGVMMGVASPISGRLFDRFGPRVLTSVGATCLMGALWTFSTMTATTPLALIIGVNCIMTLAMSLLMTPVQTTGLNQLPRHLHSHGTAINGTIQQVAGAIGTALLVTVMTVRGQSLFPGVQTLSDEQKATAIAYGLQQAFLVAACIAFVPFVLVLFLRRTAPPDAALQEGHEEAEPGGVAYAVH